MKKRILFIAPYPPGIGPSQRFRFEQYLPILQQDYEITEWTFWNEKAWHALYLKTGFFRKTGLLLLHFIRRWKHLWQVRRYDIVFLHREWAPIGPPVFEWLVAKVFRKPVIYDFDDAIWLPNVSESNWFAVWFKSFWKVKHIIRWSTHVICGNQYLADFAKRYNSNITIIPTTIDTEKYKPGKKTTNTITLGWTGTVTTTNHLKTIVPVLKRMQAKSHFFFVLISNIDPQFDFDYQFVEWNAQTEVEDLQQIDIGLMPLIDTEWEKGKCGLKALQYMALEIPAVVSPVGVNKEIIKHEQNGFFATSEQEWETVLTKLMNDDELQRKIGMAGRKTVEEYYSVKKNVSFYSDVFEKVIT